MLNSKENYKYFIDWLQFLIPLKITRFEIMCIQKIEYILYDKNIKYIFVEKKESDVECIDNSG